MAVIVPVRISPEMIELIKASGLNEEALARAFEVEPKVLREGLAGKPTTELIAGMGNAYSRALADIAELAVTTAPTRKRSA